MGAIHVRVGRSQSNYFFSHHALTEIETEGMQTMNIPYLKPWWRVTFEATQVTFHYGDQIVNCHGRAAVVLFPMLLPLLDGRHTVEQITDALGSAGSAVPKAIALLASQGLLMEGPAVSVSVSRTVREAVHFVAATQRLTRPLNDDAAALEALRVAVVGASRTAALIVAELRSLDAYAQPLAWDASDAQVQTHDLIIVAPSPAELPLMTAWNERAIQAGTTWLQVLPYDGKFASVGPLYVPGETCCYACFCHRRASVLEYPSEFWQMQQTPAPYPTIGPVEMIVAGLASMTAIRWHLRNDEALPGAFVALQFNGEMSTSTHVVYRVPRCKMCSAVERVAAPLPWFEASAS